MNTNKREFQFTLPPLRWVCTLVCIISIPILLSFFHSPSKSSATSPHSSGLLAAIGVSSGNIGNILKNAVLNKEFRPDDFEKLELVFGANQYDGLKPKIEVKANAAKDLEDTNSLWKSYIQLVTVDSNGQAIFNLRRTIHPDGRTRDALYLIIKNIKEKECERYSSVLLPHPPVVQDLNIAIGKDNREILSDPVELFPLRGCVRTPDKTVYFIDMMILRYRDKESDKWKISLTPFQ